MSKPVEPKPKANKNKKLDGSAAPKPKTALGKRVMDDRAPKVVENAKTALFVRSSTSNAVMDEMLHDLYSLKKPLASLHTHPDNDLHPFEAVKSLEFFAQKEDASFAFVSAFNKKRGHTMTLVRFYDSHVLDQCEWLVRVYESIAETGSKNGLVVGIKPCFSFLGEAWRDDEDSKHLANTILDCFRGEDVSELDPRKLQALISITAKRKEGEEGIVYCWRVYRIFLKKSGTHVPRVELESVGPSFDFILGRKQWASEELWKQATCKPRELAPKKVKNIEHDLMGAKYGRIHVGRQDLSKLQTRKVKALKNSKKKIGKDNQLDNEVSSQEDDE